MKTNTIHLTATSVVIIEANGTNGAVTTTTTPIPPFRSAFSALHEHLGKLVAPESQPDTEIIVSCNSFTYRWDFDAARRCFDERAMTEVEFADRILVVYREGEE